MGTSAKLLTGLPSRCAGMNIQRPTAPERRLIQDRMP